MRESLACLLGVIPDGTLELVLALCSDMVSVNAQETIYSGRIKSELTVFKASKLTLYNR